MAFFPPWAFSFTGKGGATIRTLGGYAYIFTPPPPKNPAHNVHIYFRMLVLQWALVAVIVGSLIVRLKGKKQE
jgi:hypothetical protein